MTVTTGVILLVSLRLLSNSYFCKKLTLPQDRGTITVAQRSIKLIFHFANFWASGESFMTIETTFIGFDTF